MPDNFFKIASLAQNLTCIRTRLRGNWHQWRHFGDIGSQVGIPVIALCDTNNQANNIDLVIPCNNKGKKSLGLVFYILAREYQARRGLITNVDDFGATLDDFTEL